MGSRVSTARLTSVLFVALGAVAIPAVTWADASADVAVLAPPPVTVGAGEPFEWDPTLSQCGSGGCPTNPTPPTIHFSTTLSAGLSMVSSGLPGQPGKLDNCLTNCLYVFSVGADQQYRYSLVANAPGTYQISIAIVSSTESDPDPSNNTATTAVTIKPLTIKLKPEPTAKPRAGKVFLWAVEPISLVTGYDVSPSKASCVARIGASRLVGIATRALGRLTCKWKIPSTAKGEKLRATVSGSLAGASASLTRQFTIG